MSLRRLAATEGNQPCFLLTVKELLARWPLALLAFQSRPQSVLDQTLTHVCDGVLVAVQSLSDVLVFQTCPVRVGEQQDVRMFDPVRRRRALGHDISKLGAFIIRKPHDILLAHDGAP